jgi:hypothetical protein
MCSQGHSGRYTAAGKMARNCGKGPWREGESRKGEKEASLAAGVCCSVEEDVQHNRGRRWTEQKKRPPPGSAVSIKHALACR